MRRKITGLGIVILLGLTSCAGKSPQSDSERTPASELVQEQASMTPASPFEERGPWPGWKISRGPGVAARYTSAPHYARNPAGIFVSSVEPLSVSLFFWFICVCSLSAIFLAIGRRRKPIDSSLR